MHFSQRPQFIFNDVIIVFRLGFVIINRLANVKKATGLMNTHSEHLLSIPDELTLFIRP
jgi:hypothetical protein